MNNEPIEPEQPAPAEVSEPENTTLNPEQPKKKRGLHSMAGWSKRKKILVLGLPLFVVILAAAVVLLTPVGYPVLSFIEKPVSFTVTDTEYKADIKDADFKLDGKPFMSGGGSTYTLKAKPGKHTLTVSKEYYNDATVNFTVKPFAAKLATIKVNLKATGRPIFVQVNNTITGKPVEKAKVSMGEFSAETDKDGKALIIVPADKNTADIKLSKDGFNEITKKLTVVQTANKTIDAKNAFTITPSGSLYFLSKRSGKIDVMKSDIDGGNPKVILAGTGQESNESTALLATRDWKYLALHAVRTDNKARIYIIDTATEKLVTADEGDASFTLSGWQNHNLVYVVNRTIESQPEKYRLKSYNAETNKLTVLERSDYKNLGSGYNDTNTYYYYTRTAEEFIQDVFTTDKLVYYTIKISGNGSYGGLKDRLMSINADGSGKTTIYSTDPNKASISYVIQSEPHEFYITTYDYTSNKQSYFEYTVGDKEAKAVTNQAEIAKFNEYFTYLLSPSGKNTLWSEPRDGKNAIFIGSPEGEDGKEVANLSEYETYGWYTDEYILVTKKGSELYIMPASGGAPFKVTDYHKPAINFNAYGGGYGGR